MIWKIKVKNLEFRTEQNRKNYVLVNKSAFVNGHLWCNILWKTPNKASRITQSQFRTKIKINFATWLDTKAGPDLEGTAEPHYWT